MSEDSIHLHILNGDYSFELWKECGFSGEGLVWRETYLEGPLPSRKIKMQRQIRQNRKATIRQNLFHADRKVVASAS
ncbi:MAG: hypothetical protein IKZ33_03530 [Lentisphaeria bacterium]|nr:hypothetical protein [Lentisphaeria bacterium]